MVPVKRLIGSGASNSRAEKLVVVGTYCDASSSESHGIRLRILCDFTDTQTELAVSDGDRYQWRTLDEPDAIAALCLDTDQYRPNLFMY